MVLASECNIVKNLLAGKPKVGKHRVAMVGEMEDH